MRRCVSRIGERVSGSLMYRPPAPGAWGRPEVAPRAAIPTYDAIGCANSACRNCCDRRRSGASVVAIVTGASSVAMAATCGEAWVSLAPMMLTVCCPGEARQALRGQARQIDIAGNDMGDIAAAVRAALGDVSLADMAEFDLDLLHDLFWHLRRLNPTNRSGLCRHHRFHLCYYRSIEVHSSVCAVVLGVAGRRKMGGLRRIGVRRVAAVFSFGSASGAGAGWVSALSRPAGSRQHGIGTEGVQDTRDGWRGALVLRRACLHRSPRRWLPRWRW